MTSTVLTPDGIAGALSTTSYLGFNGGDSNGRRVVQRVFTDPVDPTTVSTAIGRSRTVFLDELGRQRRAEVALGTDYASQTLIMGARIYDSLGRVEFEAELYPSSIEPEPRVRVRHHELLQTRRHVVVLHSRKRHPTIGHGD